MNETLEKFALEASEAIDENLELEHISEFSNRWKFSLWVNKLLKKEKSR